MGKRKTSGAGNRGAEGRGQCVILPVKRKMQVKTR